MKIALVAAALVLPAAQSAQTPEPQVPDPPAFDRMNAHVDRPDCVPLRVQIAGEDRDYNATRLDQQPPARALLAVDRRIGNCPQATLVSEERRRAAPARR